MINHENIINFGFNKVENHDIEQIHDYGTGETFYTPAYKIYKKRDCKIVLSEHLCLLYHSESVYLLTECHELRTLLLKINRY